MRIGNKVDHEIVIPLESTIVEWLMEGDPAIRWQVMRDLIGLEEQRVERERQRVAEQGWGARLLALQDPSGTWGDGRLYSPKWISTHYTLLTLRQIGLPPEHPQALKTCELILERGFYQDGGINFFKRTFKYSETCITGMVLSMLAYFHYEDERLEQIVEHLLQQQMPDGGWNCESYKGATHSSFHTTISVLEGLEDYLKYFEWRHIETGVNGKGPGVFDRGYVVKLRAAQQKGHEFLLAHRLFRSHRTGEVFDARMLRFPFPPRWRYDVLRALDYFQRVGDGGRRQGGKEVEGGNDLAHSRITRKDARIQEAIEVVKKKRKADGRWNMHAGMSGRIYFELEKAGQPSRWNTLRALRVLKWWEAPG